MKKFITLLLLLIAPFSISAEIPNESDDDSDYITNIPLDEKTKKDTRDRHRIPAQRNYVECLYTFGNLKITFESSEGCAVINLFNITNRLCFSQEFSTATPFIHNVGITYEPIRIEIVTNLHTYEGWLNPL